MNLVGVSAHGEQLAHMMAKMLVKHGHIVTVPETLDELLEVGEKFLTDTANDSTEKFSGKFAAELFFRELLDLAETLTAIAEIDGAETLADLMYLQKAILSGTSIEFTPGQSKVLETVNALPSGEKWVKFISMVVQ